MSANPIEVQKDYTVRFLKHSGVLVETDNYQFFFDIISDISAYIVHGKKQFFLISHGHHDHFDQSVSMYKSEHSTYIISDDISVEQVSSFGNKVNLIGPNKWLHIDDISIQTYESTDLGVAFYIQSPNCNIFHSGDLNWWHWDNTPKITQMEEEKAFKTIIGTVMTEPIDVAFIPLDPRLGIAATWAVQYFLDNSEAHRVIPIHFGDQYQLVKKISEGFMRDARFILPTEDNERIL